MLITNILRTNANLCNKNTGKGNGRPYIKEGYKRGWRKDKRTGE